MRVQRRSSPIAAREIGERAVAVGLMGQETELKFVGPEDALARLRRAATLRRVARKHTPHTRVLKAVYFDTESHTLREAGFVLRVRNDGKGFVQTIKSVNGANVATRMEIKAEVAEQQPEIAAIPDEALRKRIAKLLKGDELKALFGVEMKRTTILLKPQRGTEIEAAFDVGEIRCGKARLPISEFELELVKGDVPALIACARELTADSGLTLSLQSKAERGYALARQSAEAPVAAGRLGLPCGASADDAFARIVGHCLRHLLGNWPAVTAGRDPEGVHQMRVALRRLRSAFSLFGGPFRQAMKEIEVEVRWIADVLGAARDLDVFQDEVLKPAADAHGDDDRLQQLSTLVRARRRIAWHASLEALESERFRRLALELAAVTFARPWSQVPIGGVEAMVPARDFAFERLSQRYARARSLGKRIAELDVEKWHALRIKLKKLRYAVDFFSSLFSAKRTTRFLSRLSDLQDVLGEMNDAAVARALVGEMLAGHSDAAGTGVSYAAGVVVGWHVGHLRDKGGLLKKRWKRFAKATPPWEH